MKDHKRCFLRRVRGRDAVVDGERLRSSRSLRRPHETYAVNQRTRTSVRNEKMPAPVWLASSGTVASFPVTVVVGWPTGVSAHVIDVPDTVSLKRARDPSAGGAVDDDAMTVG